MEARKKGPAPADRDRAYGKKLQCSLKLKASGGRGLRCCHHRTSDCRLHPKDEIRLRHLRRREVRNTTARCAEVRCVEERCSSVRCAGARSKTADCTGAPEARCSAANCCCTPARCCGAPGARCCEAPGARCCEARTRAGWPGFRIAGRPGWCCRGYRSAASRCWDPATGGCSRVAGSFVVAAAERRCRHCSRRLRRIGASRRRRMPRRTHRSAQDAWPEAPTAFDSAAAHHRRPSRPIHDSLPESRPSPFAAG
jgi:hypothetical protein